MSVPREVLRRLLDRVPKEANPGFAARVVCAVLENGYSAEEVCDALRNRCGWECQGDPDCNKRRAELAQVAQQLIAGNNQVLVTADLVLNGLSIAFRGLVLLSRALPALRPLTVPLNLASGQIQTIRASVVARRAANDELLSVVARLAA